MSDYGQEIVDLLNADGTLANILTGGVFNYSRLGRSGLNRLQAMGAFDPKTGLLKPVGIVLSLDEAADGQAVDGQGLFLSTQTPVHILLCDNGDNGYPNVIAAFDQVYHLLHMQQIAGAFQVIFKECLKNKREPILKDCSYYRAIFVVHGFRSQT